MMSKNNYYEAQDTETKKKVTTQKGNKQKVYKLQEKTLNNTKMPKI